MLCFFICNDHVSDGICLRMCCDTFSDRKNISTWNKNNHSPRLTVPATVVTKRTQVTQQQHANAGDPTGAHGFSTTTSTSYYVTFQVESGDRMELRVSRSEYGLLAERNQGNLSFQGTRYLGFEITS